MRTILAIWFLLLTGLAHAATIDFEDYTGPFGYLAGPVSSGGYTFTATGNPEIPLLMSDNGYGGASTGNTSTVMAFCPGCIVTMAENSNALFSVSSMGLMNTGGNNLVVTGYYGAGGSIQTSYNAGGLFSTLYLGAGWDGLTSLEIAGDLSSLGSVIDDIVVTTVPIPAAAWLFASGIAVIGWLRRRQ